MNNKLIFLVVVFGLLLGLIIIIKNKSFEREKIRLEEKALSERRQFIKDSIQYISSNNHAKETRSTAAIKVGNVTAKRVEDYSSYINTSCNNSVNTIDVYVTIIDENGSISSSVSSSIAGIYNQAGKNGKTGLIRGLFVRKQEFQELLEGNSEIIEKLKLKDYADYIALGKIQYSMRPGKLVDGTIVCTASISMSVISATQKTIAKNFSFSVNGNGTTETQAKEESVRNLINKYINEYSSL